MSCEFISGATAPAAASIALRVSSHDVGLHSLPGGVTSVTWAMPVVIKYQLNVLTMRPTRVAATPGGCQIGYVDHHSGCHQLDVF
jgi:hypothetical protein